jgi:hypothetical protein
VSPDLGTCRTVTLGFVVPRQRTLPPIMQPVVDPIFIGVEALGSQPHLRLSEVMVIVWRQVRNVRRVVENLPDEELV